MDAPESVKVRPISLETFSRFLVLGLGVLYVCGFAVVFLNLSPYEVSFSISLLRAQYIVVGVLACGPIILTGLFASWFSFLSATEATISPRVVLKSVAVIAWWFVAGLGVVNFFLYEFAFPFSSQSAASTLLLSNFKIFAAFGITVAVLAYFVASTWTSIRKQLASGAWTFPQWGRTFYLVMLCLAIFYVYLASFARFIYPRIPRSAGGGKPLNVTFILKAQPNNATPVVIPDSSGNRSVPYKLLLETDQRYIVISPDPKERAIEFSRDAVIGFVVLEQQ